MQFTSHFFPQFREPWLLRVAKREPSPLSKGGAEIIHLSSLDWGIPLKEWQEISLYFPFASAPGP
jgi:hypothetical protein